MRIKSVVCVFIFFIGISNMSQISFAYNNETNNYNYETLLKTNRNYDYLYSNPPKKRLYSWGYNMDTGSGVRYTHSPSKLKGIRHAARINANNAQAYNYYY